MLDRIIGILRLDINTYEEVEHDESALPQAAIIVAIAAICQAIGNGIGALISGSGFGAAFLGLVIILIWSFVGWFLWAGVTYLIGTNVFDGEADMGEMLRVLGFAQAPLVLAIIPYCGGFIDWATISISVERSLIL